MSRSMARIGCQFHYQTGSQCKLRYSPDSGLKRGCAGNMLKCSMDLTSLRRTALNSCCGQMRCGLAYPGSKGKGAQGGSTGLFWGPAANQAGSRHPTRCLHHANLLSAAKDCRTPTSISTTSSNLGWTCLSCGTSSTYDTGGATCMTLANLESGKKNTVSRFEPKPAIIAERNNWLRAGLT